MLFTYDLVLTMVWIGALMAWTFMFIRYKTNKMNMRERIVTALIEKNPDADIEGLLKGVAPKQKLLKERLLVKLLWGSIFAVLGICFLGCALLVDFVGGSSPKTLQITYFAGFVLLGVGIAFFVNYFVSRKVLEVEIKAEEKKLAEEAGL